MHVPFAALFFFAILTLWVPGYWPVTVFQVGIFLLAAIAVWRARLSPPNFTWPLVPLSSAVLWGLFQCLTGRTAYAFDTTLAILRWATFLSVFLIGISLFQDDAVRRWFRSAILWFAFLVAGLATVQTFTSNGKVFWFFATPYTDSVMGPILNRNHYAVFIEAVLPIALYLAVRRRRESLLYSAMAAIMYASVIASASRAGTVLATAEVVLVPLIAMGISPHSGTRHRRCPAPYERPVRGLHRGSRMGFGVEPLLGARPPSRAPRTRHIDAPHGSRAPLVRHRPRHVANHLSPLRHRRHRRLRQPGP